MSNHPTPSPGTDREPQPSDGPDYHAEHEAWKRRHHSPDQRSEVRKKVVIVSVRLTPDELQRIQERAGGPVSTFLREAALREATPTYMRPAVKNGNFHV